MTLVVVNENNTATVSHKSRQRYFDLEKEYAGQIEQVQRSFTFSEWLSIAEENKLPKLFKMEKQFQIIQKVTEDISSKKISLKPSDKYADESVIESTDSEELPIKRPVRVKEIVSETLANVYLSQSLFAHSIRVLERLMLVNPEKSDYFASRISEVRKLSAEVGK